MSEHNLHDYFKKPEKVVHKKAQPKILPSSMCYIKGGPFDGDQRAIEDASIWVVVSLPISYLTNPEIPEYAGYRRCGDAEFEFLSRSTCQHRAVEVSYEVDDG